MSEKKLPAKRQKSTPHTTKKVKYIGTQKFVNSETGEIVELQVQEIAEKDFNFSKVWMRQYLLTMDLIGNQKIRVANWIIDHLDRDNRLICTFRRIADETGISLFTVRETMSALQEANFLKKIQNGAYMVNADIYFKGGHNKRLNVMSIYRDAGEKPHKLTDKEKVEELKKRMSDLQEQIDLLEGKEKIIDVEEEDQLTLSADQNGELHPVTKYKEKK